jgi:hypothetical protein
MLVLYHPGSLLVCRLLSLPSLLGLGLGLGFLIWLFGPLSETGLQVERVSIRHSISLFYYMASIIFVTSPLWPYLYYYPV